MTPDGKVVSDRSELPQSSPQNPALGVAQVVNMPRRNVAKSGALNKENSNCG